MPSPETEKSTVASAFTMVELLVATAIIAVLVALLAPVTGKMIEAAAQAKCANNLKQIGVASMAFASDHEGTLPGATRWDRDIASYIGYEGSFNSDEAEQVPLFMCPADKIKRTSGKVRSYKPNTIPSTSADVALGVLAWTSSARQTSRKLQELPYPGVTILMTEQFAADNIQFVTANSIIGAPGWLTKMSKVPVLPDGRFYHGPGQNYLFCDGHVEVLIPLDGLKIYLPDWDGGRWRALPK